MTTRISTSANRLANLIGILALSAVLLSSLPSIVMAETEINTGYFGRVAIQGYDTVAYFTQGEAARGNKEFTYDWLGARWQFLSDEHRQAFVAKPLKYAPQYGGHCAVGVAYGELTKDIDPNAWVIVDGKLYLNYSTQVNETLKKDDGSLMRKADAKWRALRKEAAR